MTAPLANSPAPDDAAASLRSPSGSVVRYLSVCSGIEAASVAWHPLGFEPIGFSEIEKFPSAVLAHHWPDVPNLGDMTQHHDWPATLRPDLIVGGTPCQAFSVAGLRQGLADPRGNLTLVFLGLLEQFRPRWVVWENVPGVLSDKTGAFGAFLGGLGQLGYGFAYRVLNAQHFGVPQRRRRVFVVGYLGDWRRAAAVLFEPACLRGDHPPRREAGQGVATTLSARTKGGGGLGTDFDLDGGLISPAVTSKWAKGSGGPSGDECQNLIAHSLRGEGFDAGEDGTGRGTPLVPVHMTALAFSCKDHGADAADIAPTLRSMGHAGSHANGGGQVAVAFAENSRHELRLEGGGKPGQGTPCVATAAAVRRLTPRECERLQGFPDDHTLIPWRGKMAPDGPRYKALGNSMAVPVMRWIGEHISRLNASLSHGDKSACLMLSQLPIKMKTSTTERSPMGSGTCSPSLARWFCDGRTGSSSLAMASIHLGGKPKRGPTPADPSDLNRCLLLIEAAPEIRESFPTIAAHSPQWAALIARWDEVEALFMEECGRDWSKSSVGKRTYRLMCEISDGVNDQAEQPPINGTTDNRNGK